MSLHCAFLFPRNQFKLIFMSTIGYISDNMFYRLNLQTAQTQIQLNPHGRSYQAFTSNHKRGLVVLADYGKNPNISFNYLHKKQNSVEIKDICTLQIDCIELSLNCKYLLIACGIPERRIIIVDVEMKRLLKGQFSFIQLQDRKVRRMQFNPANHKIFAIMFEKHIQIYHISEQFRKQEYGLQQHIKIQKKGTISSDTPFETFLWDEINNIYTSNGRNVNIYSSQNLKQIISYDLEGDFDGQVISNFILTQKHLLLVYCNGRIQWILKYDPDLMDEQQISKKPFYMQRYYEFPKQISYALYDHTFTQIFVAHKNGLLSVLKRPAQSKQNQDQDEDNKISTQNKSDKDKKLQADVSQVGPYHAHKIIFCRQVKDRAILMTVSSAGKIIFWSLIQKKPIAFIQTGLQTVSADVNLNFSLLCLSNNNGIIRFLSIADFQNIFLIKQLKLIEKGQINQVQFSSNSQQLACLSTKEKRIFYLLTDQNNQIQVLGYVNLPYTPLSICWNKTTKTLVKPKFQHLLCCIGFGILMINGPTPISSKLRGKQFQLNCDIYGLRTDPQQKHIDVLPSGQILCTGSDKILKKYKQPQDSITKFNPQSKSPIPPPIDEVQSHDLQTTYMRVQNKVFISCGANGTLQIRPIQNFNNVTSLQVHGWKYDNINFGAASSIDGLYFICGKNGCLSFWKTKQIEIRSSDQIKKQKSKYPKIKSLGDELKFFEVAIQDEYLQKMKDTISKKKKDQLDKITKIKSQLKQLLAENESHDELQRMSRDQFVIDLQLRQRITKASVQNCQKIKKQSNRNVLYNEVYRNKLKQLTWDQMQEHLRAINGLKNNYIVYNYQIRKIGYEERRKLQVVLDLRKNQIRQLKKRNKPIIDTEFYKNKNVINGGILQPLILTVVEKKDDKKQEKTKKKKEEQAAEKQPQEVQQLPKQQIWQLLYSSFELFSDNAKINQVVMMQNIIIKIKQAFNKQFNKLLKFRQNQNQMINDKNKRIIQICDELKRKHEIIVSKKNILQNPDLVLQVNNKDIPFARYLSREQREKAEKQRLKQEQRLRALAQDDSSQRALQKMMGGTLQQKKTSVLQVTVERQKWMDKPLQQMTQQEKNKLKEFQQKRIKAEQQKQRIVKKLQAELRRLRSQIDDTMEKYDQKLFSLLRRRIQYDLRIQEQELYCIKLLLSISSYKEDSQKLDQLKNKQSLYQQKIQELQTQHRLLLIQQQEIQRAKQQKKNSLDGKKYAENEVKIKTIQKSIFQEYQNNVKKRRQIQEKLIQTDQTVAYQIIALDPMKQIQSKNLSNQISQQYKVFEPYVKAMQQTIDFHEDHTIQNRFNIRKQQNDLQRRLKGIKDSIKKLQQTINSQRNNKQQDQKQILRLQRDIQQSRSDLQILFRIRKGFVEIDSETPVPQLSDALLLGKQKIDKRNLQIIDKAELKIKIMQQIKTCKITVTQQSLQLQKNQALIDQLSSMIKQVQMLKVKKQMQTALAKKDTKINQNELRSLKQQIQKVRKQGEKRINLFEKKIEKVNQQIQAIRKQNKQLQVQKWNLQNTVKQREKIKDMMVGENGQGNQEAAEKFEQISINRKLFDKAKQQTDEIELLREELSKLKAKTFANFSSVQR